MSFWQHLTMSYDQNAEEMKKTYPLSTTSISNNSEWIAVVVINGEGEFQSAYKIEAANKNKKKGEPDDIITINIPVREKSASRTSDAKKEPHPVFEQYKYLDPNGERFDRYLEELKAFASSSFATQQVKAIFIYIQKKTIEKDLHDLRAKPDTFVIFKVQIPGNPQAKVWKNTEFYDAWHRYYLSTITSNGIDQISGSVQPLAISHPKKISNASANSKLISSNDAQNFTFRGRFKNSEQAVNVGYESSQKAHQFLRYLVNDRGYTCDEQVILSYTIGSKLADWWPRPLDNTYDIYSYIQDHIQKTEMDKLIALSAETGRDYAVKLRMALHSLKYFKNELEQHAQSAVIALDAPTNGRMAVTFYHELECREYLTRIADWHDECKWHSRYFQQKDDKITRYSYIGAPSVDRIIEAVHGKPRSYADESYMKVKKGAREQLLRCIFDGAPLPANYISSAVRRASNPQAVTKGGKFDRDGFDQVVSTACALVRKDFKQSKKEDFKLSIEHERTDRDYLFGRLLGAADKLEEHALYRDARERTVTAAIRYMQAFSQRPFRTWHTIHDSLVPYIQKVKGDFAFQEIEKIKNLFIPGDFEKDTQLNGSYLIGYYHERAFIDSRISDAATKKTQALETTTENSDE
ncbi:MAG: type I-C CRISPR-associated protein Cas8c/Csd1 [Lentisphaeria bacterium]|jgi:CRISPR-associated protein Csd1